MQEVALPELGYDEDGMDGYMDADGAGGQTGMITPAVNTPYGGFGFGYGGGGAASPGSMLTPGIHLGGASPSADITASPLGTSPFVSPVVSPGRATPGWVSERVVSCGGVGLVSFVRALVVVLFVAVLLNPIPAFPTPRPTNDQRPTNSYDVTSSPYGGAGGASPYRAPGGSSPMYRSVASPAAIGASPGGYSPSSPGTDWRRGWEGEGG